MSSYYFTYLVKSVDPNNLIIIYLADDDEEDRFFIKDALKNLNRNIFIIEAIDGHDLLEKMTDTALSLSVLIILDMNMPRLNGLEALKALRNNPSTRMTPAIMLSTASDKDLVKEAYHLGINAYLKKPNNIGEFTEIAEAINKCFLENAY